MKIITANVTTFSISLFLGEYHGAFVCETFWPLMSHNYALIQGQMWDFWDSKLIGAWDNMYILGVKFEDYGLRWIGPIGRVVVGLKKQHIGYHSGLQKLICHLPFINLLINIFLVGKRRIFNVLHSNHLVSPNPQSVGETEVVMYQPVPHLMVQSSFHPDLPFSSSHTPAMAR